MATWQYDLYVIPRARAVELFETVPEHMDRELVDRIDWWQGHHLPDNYKSIINTLLPARESWNENSEAWGEEDGDSLEVIGENEDTAEVFVRINTAEISNAFIEGLINLAQYCRCLLLLMENMKLIEPDLELLLVEIKRSKAMQYVKSPSMFFQNLERENRSH